MNQGNIEETMEAATSETAGVTNKSESKKDMRMVTLVSRDDCRFTLPVSAASLSEMVQNAIVDETGGEDEDGDELPTPQDITVLNVMGSCLEKVVEFLKHHEEEKFQKVILPLLKNTFNENATQEWYRDFMNDMDTDMVYQVMGAANYMNIKPLLELACLKVTFLFSDKTAEEIQDLLDLPKNLTPEEQAREYQEYAWIFDEDNHKKKDDLTSDAEGQSGAERDGIEADSS